ncbi:hypothetical protein [Parabacteroides sp. AM08-6]|uniref:hypothetical protein n=1 Tax=Parabacteroides sp. AM08-6 TaxID=2292053 RepID=UPI000EFDF3DD|nr:hypothetical protein [Parabacteroides sp. AM08-6]RHJ76129.1 hypothetical protein DW103_17230 [Parabacteroides sp. AM08-6]
MALVIISFIVFLVYLAGTCKSFGIPYSISDTYYKLEKRKKGLGWLFSVMCVSVGGLLLPALLDITPSSYQFTAFLACAGLLFVGAAPQFKLPLTNTVHYSAAAVCVIFSQIWVGLTFWWLLIPIWLAFIVYTVVGMSKHVTGSLWRDFIAAKPMFWCEVAALGSTYLTVFLAS